MKSTVIHLLVIGIIAQAMLLSSCESESQDTSVAENAMKDLRQKYDELLKDNMDAPVDWASDDLENIGDWEYRVVDLSFSSADDLESQLNEFGNERWQVVWLERTPKGYFAVMKKPSISYLSKIPLSELSRLITGGSASSE